jgi:hypothetical protein
LEEGGERECESEREQMEHFEGEGEVVECLGSEGEVVGSVGKLESRLR